MNKIKIYSVSVKWSQPYTNWHTLPDDILLTDNTDLAEAKHIINYIMKL